MKRLITLLGVIYLAIMCSIAHAGYPMTVKDARGKAVLIKAKPMRIVSLAPSNTEILFALGLNDRVVGVTNYCNYPVEAKKKHKIGDMNVNVEAVVALKPDLVFAHAYVNDAALGQLEKLGLTVFAINPKTTDQVIRDIRTVGNITARPKSAETVAKKMEKAFTEAKITAKKVRLKVHPPSTLVVIQSNPLWAAGPKTLIDEMIKITDAKNIAFDARAGFVPFSKELAISRNPDVIIVGLKTDADYFAKDSVWKTTKAVKNKRVYVISNDLLVRPGPRLADGIKQLADKLIR